MATTLIKISILWQYMRLAGRDHKIFRWSCIVMIGAVSCWGAIFFFLSVFSCVPMSAFWDIFQPGQCIMFGSRDPEIKVNA
jgi:hypothetical protein